MSPLGLSRYRQTVRDRAYIHVDTYKQIKITFLKNEGKIPFVHSGEMTLYSTDRVWLDLRDWLYGFVFYLLYFFFHLSKT